MKNLSGILTACLVFSFASAAFSQDRVRFNNQDLFLSGANFAWVNFARDVGSGVTDFARFQTILEDVSENGGNCMRLWLHTTGAATPQFDSNGMVVGPGENTIADLRGILDIAWQNHVAIMPCLWSFDMLNTRDNPVFVTDRAYSMLTDEAFLDAYIQTSLIPMIEALKGHPAIVAWEIFNEPEGMSNEFGWDFTRHVPMANIQRFVNRCSGAIHRTDPGTQVTNGSWSFQATADVATSPLLKRAKLTKAERTSIERQFEAKYRVPIAADGILDHLEKLASQRSINYYSDSALTAAGGDQDGTLDFYGVHYWNWMGQSISSFHNPASHWNLDKPVVVGEFGMSQTYSPTNIPTVARFETLFTNGYAGALAWSWTDTQLSTPQQMLAGMLDIKMTYPEAVTLRFPAGSILDFSANPVLIEKGETSVLSWETSEGSSVTLNGESVDPNGTLSIAPDSTTVYRLVTAGDFSDSSEITVEVLLPGTIYLFIAEPGSIAAGDSTLLTWATVAGSSVALDGEAVPRSGSLKVSPPGDQTYTLIATGDISDTSIVEVHVTEAGNVNLALGKPVFSSSNETIAGNTLFPELAVDGDPATRWSSEWQDGLQLNPNSQWFYVDLQVRYEIKRVVLNWQTAFGQIYSIQVSDDAQKWSTIYSTNSGDGGIDDLINLSGSGRFVSMRGNQRGTQWGYSLWEFEVYGVLDQETNVAGRGHQPLRFALDQNYPNPFNPTTWIHYSLTKKSKVSLTIYDGLGRSVLKLVEGTQAPGNYEITLDGKGLASGVYYYRLQADNDIKVRKMLLVR